MFLWLSSPTKVPITPIIQDQDASESTIKSIGLVFEDICSSVGANSVPTKILLLAMLLFCGTMLLFKTISAGTEIFLKVISATQAILITFTVALKEIALKFMDFVCKVEYFNNFHETSLLTHC